MEKYVDLNDSKCANPPIKIDDAPIKTQRIEDFNQQAKPVDIMVKQHCINQNQPQKTCFKCPKYSRFFLARKNALLHFEKYHHHINSEKIK